MPLLDPFPLLAVRSSLFPLVGATYFTRLTTSFSSRLARPCSPQGRQGELRVESATFLARLCILDNSNAKKFNLFCPFLLKLRKVLIYTPADPCFFCSLLGSQGLRYAPVAPAGAPAWQSFGASHPLGSCLVPHLPVLCVFRPKFLRSLRSLRSPLQGSCLATAE